MKRILLLLLMLTSVFAFAQKQQKPNINKAHTLWQEGKLDEAKQMIDAATTYEKTMNDGKTWYYRGLIYASLDTTSNEKFKGLEAEPLKVALESFVKSDELSKGNTEYFTQGANALVPVTKPQQLEMLANYYLDKGIKAFQDDQDYEASLKALDKTKQVFEKQLPKYANDTLTYYVVALVAQQAENYDLAIENIKTYLDKGGKSKDAYLILYQIYNGPKEDKAKALEAIQQGKAKLPDNPDFPKVEIGLLIDLGRIQQAKAGLEDAIKKEPDNKILYFYLGYINARLAETEKKKIDSVRNAGGIKPLSAKAQESIAAYNTTNLQYLETARKNFQEAVRLDPSYYDAHVHLANTYLVDVDKTSKELSSMGNTPADSKKRSELVQRRVRESEKALPYLERVEKMQAPDKDTEIEVLQKLGLLYYYIADDKNSARIDKKLKALGVTDN